MWHSAEDLLVKFNPDSDTKRYFLIFDIDGTLRPDEIESLDHRYPKISPQTAKQIHELNQVENFDIVILTARSYVDLFKSNFPRSITKYAACGRQIIENDVLKYPKPEFQQSYDETVMFIDLLKDILGKQLIANLDFLVTPGDFALYFDLDDYTATKSKVMDKITLLLENSSRWEVKDFGKEVIFFDNRYQFDKGHSVGYIMDALDLNNSLHHLFMFGDSMTDVQAMVGLRNYQKQYPSKRLKVTNVSVGDKIKDKSLPEDIEIDFKFETYQETLRFVDYLHKTFC